MEDTNLMWRKATYSSNGGGSCVETASTRGVVLVRDSTDRDGVTLEVRADVWQEFMAALK
jgi:Domain of unknown function (DUF397)